MLTNLHVKNLALIEEADVNFEEGLNILTGETGAGKSIIIGSINYALGAKAGRDVIRSGAEYALVELVFQVSQEELKQKIAELELPLEEDGTVIITRKIMPSRSILKVCGETVTARQVKELALLLLDIHGQHEHQSLLQPVKQREVLDRFAGEEMQGLKQELAGEVRLWHEMKQELERLSMDDSAREREISLARFEVEEIEGAALKPGEEAALEANYRKMQNAKKIAESMECAIGALGRDDFNALDQIGIGLKELNSAAQMDEELCQVRDRLADAEGFLSDVYHELVRYQDAFSFGEEEFAEAERRLNTLNHLMLKYGGTVEKVMEYGTKRRQELDKLEDLAGYLAALKEKEEKQKAKVVKLCKKLHEIRTGIAAELSAQTTKILEELNFLKVSYGIEVRETEHYTSEGYDEVSFMISLNPGEEMKPLSEVASGGELSRIMLALKAVFADKDETGTLIFDEIDSGISGRTAWKVSERMAAISREHQVICITHLPQIAAMADVHFMIEKSEAEGRTVTDIQELSEDGTLAEVARLLGADDVSEAGLTNARELRMQAGKVKAQKI